MDATSENGINPCKMQSVRDRLCDPRIGNSSDASAFFSEDEVSSAAHSSRGWMGSSETGIPPIVSRFSFGRPEAILREDLGFLSEQDVRIGPASSRTAKGPPGIPVSCIECPHSMPGPPVIAKQAGGRAQSLQSDGVEHCNVCSYPAGHKPLPAAVVTPCPSCSATVSAQCVQLIAEAHEGRCARGDGDCRVELKGGRAHIAFTSPATRHIEVISDSFVALGKHPTHLCSLEAFRMHEVAILEQGLVDGFPGLGCLVPARRRGLPEVESFLDKPPLLEVVLLELKVTIPSSNKVGLSVRVITAQQWNPFAVAV